MAQLESNAPTIGDDVIIGTSGDDLIDALEGNDTVFGLAGNDFLFGWYGNDILNGGDGDDWLFGEGGTDTLTGGAGNDVFGEYDQWLNGDTITDFSVGDIILIRDANISTFTFSLVGDTLTFSGAQTPEFQGGTMTLSGAAGAVLVASAHPEGGVQIVMQTPPIRDVLNDFNGDGRSDILWRNTNGTLTNWLGQANGGFTSNSGTFVAGVAVDWTIVGTGDFNGDRRDDILWRNSSGTVTDWLGQANGGFAPNSGTFVAGVSNDWTVVGIGDFNGDRRDDILWRNSSGTITDWLGQSNGGFTSNSGTFVAGVATDWTIVGTGDFNGDGKDDILWRNSSGTVTDWLGQANGGFAPNSATFVAGVSNDWTVVGIGDFNGDRRDDILWRNSSGTITDWLGQANGEFASNSGTFVAGVSTAWTIAQIGDFNGDRRDDILWRHTDGTITNWLGQANGGFTPNSGTFVAGVGSEWLVQPNPSGAGYWDY